MEVNGLNICLADKETDQPLVQEKTTFF